MGPCKGIGIRRKACPSLGRGNKDLSFRVDAITGQKEGGKDTRAIVEGLGETWRQILSQEWCFSIVEEKYTDLNERKLSFLDI